jgi:tetrahydromethanopterin S-methyltransferase subunit F
MNLRNWTKNHTYGLIIGIISPLIFIPLVILMLSWIENFQFSQLMSKFMNASIVRSKIISIAIISNLIWFYLSLNREKWGLAMGIIVATILFLPYILYVNFFL